jgi:hypothetical protein
MRIICILMYTYNSCVGDIITITTVQNSVMRKSLTNTLYYVPFK